MCTRCIFRWNACQNTTQQQVTSTNYSQQTSLGSPHHSARPSCLNERPGWKPEVTVHRWCDDKMWRNIYLFDEDLSQRFRCENSFPVGCGSHPWVPKPQSLPPWRPGEALALAKKNVSQNAASQASRGIFKRQRSPQPYSSQTLCRITGFQGVYHSSCHTAILWCPVICEKTRLKISETLVVGFCSWCFRIWNFSLQSRFVICQDQ